MCDCGRGTNGAVRCVVELGAAATLLNPYGIDLLLHALGLAPSAPGAGFRPLVLTGLPGLSFALSAAFSAASLGLLFSAASASAASLVAGIRTHEARRVGFAHADAARAC